MISKIERNILVLCLVATIAAVVFSPVQAYCETLRFVFMADSRGDSIEEPVNTPVLNAIISKIKALSPQPAFVVFGGDMSYRGCIKGTYTFQSWKDLFTPLTSAGISLYTTVGNHELYAHGCGTSNEGFFQTNQQEYQKVFKENPSNGPPGYEKLVYSFTSPKGDAFFAVLDSYYQTADDPSPSISGTIDSTQLTWLENQVAQTKASHKFLFIHTPYYYITGTNPADPAEGPGSPDVTFTNLWSFLDKNKFDIYACGHTHLYSRKAIDSSILPRPQTSPNPTPPWQNNVIQLITGTCGAPVDTATPTVANPALWHISEASYYFSVVDIIDSKVTITSYSGNTGDYSVFDTNIATILANNQSQSIAITDNTPLSVTAALDPGSLSGQNADWWVAADTPVGPYSLTPSGWSAGINMLAQNPLLKIGPEEVFKGYLPVGDYTFYFGVDMSPDGIPNNPLYYDGVQVHVTLDTTEHDNWVFLTPVPGNPSLAFGLADHVITSGQPWGGVSTGTQDQNWGIDVKAGRHASSSAASWFRSHASAATCANWPSGCPDWPSDLNFALTGTLTINGAGYPVTIGQGSVGPHNNWWIGGPGWTMHSSILGDAVVTPDGKYFFEPADDTFNQFWIRTSY